MESKKFWNSTIIVSIVIAGFTGYAYAASILLQFGQNSYFDTHESLIDVSIRNNVIWFFIFLKAFRMFISLISWWQWFVVVLTVLLCVTLGWVYKLLGDNKRVDKVIGGVGIVLIFIFILYSLQAWSNIGYEFASNRVNHLVLAPGCDFADPGEAYVVTSIYEGKAVLVPVDRDTRKMQERFFVKDLSDLACGMEYEELGRIER